MSRNSFYLINKSTPRHAISVSHTPSPVPFLVTETPESPEGMNLAAILSWGEGSPDEKHDKIDFGANSPRGIC